MLLKFPQHVMFSAVNTADNWKVFNYAYNVKVEKAIRRCSVKKLFLEISQNSQENTCARVSFLIKLQAAPATLLKKRLWHRCFPVNFAKFLRTPFLTEHLRWLLILDNVLTYLQGNLELNFIDTT